VDIRLANVTTHYKGWDDTTKDFTHRSFTTDKVLQYFDEKTKTWKDLEVVDIDAIAGREVTKDELSKLSWTR